MQQKVKEIDEKVNDYGQEDSNDQEVTHDLKEGSVHGKNPNVEEVDSPTQIERELEDKFDPKGLTNMDKTGGTSSRKSLVSHTRSNMGFAKKGNNKDLV